MPSKKQVVGISCRESVRVQGTEEIVCPSGFWPVSISVRVVGMADPSETRKKGD